MDHIAVIGLGVMGGPMVTCLRAAGIKVTAMDVNPDAQARFAGGPPDSQMLHNVDAVLTMLPEGAHVAQVHQDVILPGARPGTIIADCSTIDVATTQTLANAATEAGLLMVDAPVSGGPEAAKQGSLSFMVGGSDAAFSAARPLLETLGRKITHFGPPGSGQAAKACHNMICGITAMAVIEGFALADALDLDLAQFHALCTNAAAQSWTLDNRCPIPGVVAATPASNGYAPGFAARLMAKDLRLAQEASAQTGQTTPFGAQAAAAFTSFAQTGGGDLDFSAFYQQLRPAASRRPERHGPSAT